MKRFFYIECHENFWIDAIKKLQDEHNLKPVYWSGISREKNKILKIFPDVIYHDTLEAIRGIAPKQYKDLKLKPIDEVLLKDMSYYESIVLTMMDRMDPDDCFYHHERKRLYHYQLRYWLTILEECSTDIVIFPYIPHIVFDYILYVLCQYKKIRTLVFQTSSVNGILLPLNDFEDETFISKLFNKQKSKMPKNVILSKSSEDYLNKIRGSYNSYLNTMASDTRDMIITSSWSKVAKIPCFLKTIKFYLSAIRSLSRPKRLNYLKKKNEKIEDISWTDFEYRLYKRKAGIRKKLLKKYYESLVEDADLSQPYIYIPLHYQPECSSSPMAGFFVEQFIMIDLLLKSIPDNWKIYIKESFWQNNENSHGERWGRARKNFYDDVSALERVSFVSISIPQWDLIDNSKAVATLTGTSGWEAVVRGIPAIIFGHSWYKGCEGVFYTPTKNELIKVIKKISNGYTVDYEKIKLFVHILEKTGVKGYVSSHYSNVAGVTYKENINILINTLLSISGILK